LVMTPSGGIPAASGTTPSSATCTIVKRISSGLDDTERDQKVYNFGGAVEGSKIILAHRDAFGDLWASNDVGCTDLSQGTYRATCGATIAQGETGPVIATGCDGEVTLDAVNHSECIFYLGDRITLSIDPCCVAHFTGCSCCGATHEPPACCDISIAICIAGVSKILAVDGGTYTWDVAECCDCVGATLDVTLSCVEGVITADWEYTCSGTTTGSIVLTTLCNFSADVEILDQLTSLCDGNLNDRWANFVEDCTPCGPVDPCADPNDCVTTDCCPDNPVPKTLQITLVGGANAGTYTLTYGAGEWTVDGGEPFTCRLSCLGGGNFWELIIEMETYGEDTAACDPFSLTFDTSVPANGIGVTSATVSIP
jgi:hypothetical protein